MGCGYSTPAYAIEQAYVNSNSKAKVMKEIMCDRSTVEGLLKLVGDPKFQMTIRSSATNAPKLMPGIKDLELCMPRDVRDAPMRLVHLHKLLEWLHLEVYENMKDEDFVTFPYGQTTAETWRSTILLSWRWSLGKPDTLECDHSPMSGLQLKYMKMALLVAREANPDLKYVWIDWSCVPQYSASPMLEVARSKVYYARAQQMIVLPDIVELDSSVETLLRLVLESLCEDPLWADSEHAQMAAHVINAIISDGVHAKLQYFGRVWTLAERLARCSWDEELHYWLSLQLWMGMVIDALASSSEDQNGSAIYWAKLFSAEIRDNMDKVSAKLRLSLELGNYRKTGLISEVATLLVEAVKVWLSAKMNEVPSEQWLSRYLESEAIEIYQAWSKPDAIWSVLSYFSWKVYDDKRRSTTEGLSDALSVLCSIAGIVPETTTVWKYLEEEAASHEKLMGACKAGDSNTVVVLLNLHPSIVNSKDKGGETALMRAAGGGALDCVKALLEKGADIDAKDNDGLTALMWAAYKGYLECVQALLEKGADAAAKDNDGWTALIFAARNGRLECVKALLEKGADTAATNNDGKTAYDRADTDEIKELLKTYMR